MKTINDFKSRWQYTEYLFEEYFKETYPRCFVYRFPDFADLNFKQGRRTNITGMQSAMPQPADYLVTYSEPFSPRANVEFMEVKATKSTTSFKLSDVRPAQWHAAKRQTMAGGKYYFIIEAYELKEWYKVPAELFLIRLHRGDKSVKFSELSFHIWGPMREYLNNLDI